MNTWTYLLATTTILVPTVVIAATPNATGESKKQQYIADINKHSPHDGAALYQLNIAYEFMCGKSPSLNNLINLKKTNAYSSLVLKSKKNNLNGLYTVINTFKEFEETPCKNS